MDKYIGFWQAVVQTRIWLSIKNAATVYPHTYVITVPHFFSSVSNSTAYWLPIINNNHNCVLYQATAARSATGRSAHMEVHCVGVILRLIERTKSLKNAILCRSKN